MTVGLPAKCELKTFLPLHLHLHPNYKNQRRLRNVQQAKVRLRVAVVSSGDAPTSIISHRHLIGHKHQRRGRKHCQAEAHRQSAAGPSVTLQPFLSLLIHPNHKHQPLNKIRSRVAVAFQHVAYCTLFRRFLIEITKITVECTTGNNQMTVLSGSSTPGDAKTSSTVSPWVLHRGQKHHF